jgi:hypothetical protein
MRIASTTDPAVMSREIIADVDLFGSEREH